MTPTSPDCCPRATIPRLFAVQPAGSGPAAGAGVLTVVGMSTAGLAGRTLVRLGERLLSRMPVVRGVYGTLKQIFETVLAQKSRSFRSGPGRVPAPRRRRHRLRDRADPRRDSGGSGEELVNVFCRPRPTRRRASCCRAQERTDPSRHVGRGDQDGHLGRIVGPPAEEPEEAREALARARYSIAPARSNSRSRMRTAPRAPHGDRGRALMMPRLVARRRQQVGMAGQVRQAARGPLWRVPSTSPGPRSRRSSSAMRKPSSVVRSTSRRARPAAVSGSS